MTDIGPMPLSEHLVWLGVLSLSVSLVYNGLRVDSVKESVARGLRRWVVFLGGCALLEGIMRVVEWVWLS